MMSEGAVLFMTLLIIAAIAFFYAVYINDISSMLVGSLVIVCLVGVLFYG